MGGESHQAPLAWHSALGSHANWETMEKHWKDMLTSTGTILHGPVEGGAPGLGAPVLGAFLQCVRGRVGCGSRLVVSIACARRAVELMCDIEMLFQTV